MEFDVRPDRTLVRTAGVSRRYALISFTAPLAPPNGNRIPINVSFVLDRSGSMGGAQKMELVHEAVDKAMGMLCADDRFNVVVYDDKIDVLMEATLASDEAKHAARRELGRITARGSTNLSGGWLRGCEQAAMHINEAVPAKCLLLTDGLANTGIINESELVRHAGELRQRGVLTSTFGVGSDFDEVLLQKMADAGGGHSYYIEKAVQIPDFLTSELGETLEIVARNAALQLTLATGMKAQPLNPFRFESSGESLVIDLGNLVSGQEVSVVVELYFPARDIGDSLSASIGLTDRDGVLHAAPVVLTWTFADDAANDTQPRDRTVDAAVAELYAAKARTEALELNREGAFDSARAVIHRTAERIRSYAGDIQSLHQLADALLKEEELYQERMSILAMKASSYSSHHAMRNRGVGGKSKRKIF